MITCPLTTAAPRQVERSKTEEPSTLITSERQEEPSTQGSLKVAVMGCGHPTQEPGLSTDHDTLHTSKSRGLCAKKKTFLA